MFEIPKDVLYVLLPFLHGDALTETDAQCKLCAPMLRLLKISKVKAIGTWR